METFPRADAINRLAFPQSTPSFQAKKLKEEMSLLKRLRKLVQILFSSSFQSALSNPLTDIVKLWLYIDDTSIKSMSNCPSISSSLANFLIELSASVSFKRTDIKPSRMSKSIVSSLSRSKSEHLNSYLFLSADPSRMPVIEWQSFLSGFFQSGLIRKIDASIRNSFSCKAMTLFLNSCS